VIATFGINSARTSDYTLTVLVLLFIFGRDRVHIEEPG
jgi:hypothetical protein